MKENILRDLREEYGSRNSSLKATPDLPHLLFEQWLQEAMQSSLPEPNAMILSTWSSNTGPDARIVLLKAFSSDGFVFFSNYNSLKAKHIKEESKVSLLFVWLELEQQVRVRGRAFKTSATESDVYFASRPRGSQLGAWASSQSEKIDSPATLLKQYEDIEAQYRGKTIPRPPYWGGYRVIPEYFEFWQGGKGRMHERLVYVLRGSQWEKTYLAP